MPAVGCIVAGCIHCYTRVMLAWLTCSAVYYTQAAKIHNKCTQYLNYSNTKSKKISTLNNPEGRGALEL